MKPPLLAVLVAISPVPHSLRAQGNGDPAVVYTLRGEKPLDGLGEVLARLDDLDGDGVPEFAVSALQDYVDPEGNNKGYVQIVSGKTGTVLRTLRGRRGGGLARAWFGERLVPIFDVDGDGHGELIVRDRGSRAFVYSPRTGELLREFIPDEDEPDWSRIASAGDLDRDGVEDLVVSSPSHGFISLDVAAWGLVFAFSLVEDRVLWRTTGRWSRNVMGFGVLGVTDLTGDGTPDVLVTEVLPAREVGQVTLLSGRNGLRVRSLHGDLGIGVLGEPLVKLGDFTGDGIPEIGLGGDYPRDEPWHLGRGVALVLDGSSLGVLRRHEGIRVEVAGFSGDRVGDSIAPAGDLDGDGVDDYLVGAWANRGVNLGGIYTPLYLRSGRTGRLLMALEGRHGDGPFVGSVAPLGDVDGDGVPEFIVGSPDNPDSPTRPREGEVRLLRYESGAPAFLRGDANGDGRVNLADCVALVRVLILGEEPAVGCLQALDVDGNDLLIPSDILELLRHFFSGNNSRPGEPYPECARYRRIEAPLRLSCEVSTCTP